LGHEIYLKTGGNLFQRAMMSLVVGNPLGKVTSADRKEELRG
jgi:hypothetical protein